MKKIISIILCGMLFLFLSTLAAPVQPAKLPSKPGAIQITTQASDISINLKLQQQKLEFFKERLDLQDKRISDLNFYLSCFGVLMTVIVVFFSFRSTREAMQAAKDEARNEVKAQAKNIIESWLDKDGKQELVKKVEDTLNPKIAIALGEIDNKATNVLNKLEDERRTTQMINDKSLELQARHERAMINLSHSIDTTKPLSEKQREKVQEAAQEIESRAPNKYRFEDWNMLGIQAFESAKYEVALTQFIRAEKVSSEPIQLSKALVNKGAALAQMGRNEEAIAAYDEVVHRFGEATEEPLRAQVATALGNKGKTLGKMGRDEEAIAVYDKVVRHFGEATEAPLREQVATALVNKGGTLDQMEWNNEAIAAYDEVVRRFCEATEAPLREQVATALMNKGKTLGKMGQDQEAIAVYDKVVRLFGEATKAPLREQVATALMNKGKTLGKMGQDEEAIAVYDKVVRLFGEAMETPLRMIVSETLLSKGNNLFHTGQSKENAIAVYDEVVRRFGEAKETPLRAQVARALMNKGRTLEHMARDEEAIAVYDEVARLFGEEKETPLRMKVSETLLSKGVVLENIGRSKEADAVYDELARRLGEEKELPLLKPIILIIIWMYKSVRRLFSWSVSNRRRHKK